MNRDEHGFPIPRKQFTISQDHGESSYAFQVFSTDEIAKEFPELMDPKYRTEWAICPEVAEELIATLSPLRASDNGPGRWFRSAPTIRIGKRNIVIRQFGGLDI